MKGQSISIYLNDKYIYIIKKTLRHIEAEQYKLKDKYDVLKFGLRLVRKYFNIKDPLSAKELKSLKEWI